MSLIAKLINNDKRLVFRDRFLVFMAIAGLLLAVIIRYLLPWANLTLAAKGYMPSETIDFALSALYPMLVPFIALYNGAMMSGIMFGFLMIEEKEERTLIAFGVTPVPLYYYTLYRFGTAAIFSFMMIVIMMLIINIVALPFWQLLLFAAGASLFSILAALFLVLTAQNKVQGFAFAKFLSLSGWVILAGWFIPMPWQWLLGIFPPFYIHKAYWLALEGDSLWWWVLLLGVIIQLIAIVIMNKYSQNKMLKPS